VAAGSRPRPEIWSANASPFPTYWQGIDAFDEDWTNVIVTNNVVITVTVRHRGRGLALGAEIRVLGAVLFPG
jgi:hypothetical protein